jgi:hypothetical protein
MQPGRRLRALIAVALAAGRRLLALVAGLHTLAEAALGAWTAVVTARRGVWWWSAGCPRTATAAIAPRLTGYVGDNRTTAQHCQQQ